MDYTQAYERAQTAYMDGEYEAAAHAINQLIMEYPEDPSARLLCGHIYCYGLQEYEVALEQYQYVLESASDPDLLAFANTGMNDASKQLTADGEMASGAEAGDDRCSESSNAPTEENSPEAFANQQTQVASSETPAPAASSQQEPTLADVDFDIADESDRESPLSEQAQPDVDPFAVDMEALGDEQPEITEESAASDNPFSSNLMEEVDSQFFDEETASLETSEEPEALPADNPFAVAADAESSEDEEDLAGEEGEEGFPFATPEAGASPEGSSQEEPENPLMSFGDLELSDSQTETPAPSAPTGETSRAEEPPSSDEMDDFADLGEDFFGDESESGEESPEEDDFFGDESDSEEATLATPGLDWESQPQQPSSGEEGTGNGQQGETTPPSAAPLSAPAPTADQQNGHNWTNEFDFDSFDDIFNEEAFPNEEEEESDFNATSESESETPLPADLDQQGYLLDFDEFDDIGTDSNVGTAAEDDRAFSMDEFEGNFDAAPEAESAVASGSAIAGGEASDASSYDWDTNSSTESSAIAADEFSHVAAAAQDFSPGGSYQEPTSGLRTDTKAIEPPIPRQVSARQLVTSSITGAFCALAIATGTYFLSYEVANQDSLSREDRGAVLPKIQLAGFITSVSAGLVGGATTFILNRRQAKRIQKSVHDLGQAFHDVIQGDLTTRAPVSEDEEFGQLARQFNQMSQVILSTTREAQRKAEEQEQAKEDLQRQVIRLLDDVEGAARGDLTVKAEVTASVLGAVADSFNLTIQNLREIVQQVKKAARQVSESSKENEKFAVNLSSDALRQAEELAATLNSVQVMTDSIQRVAVSAREAEEVARSASATALRGGEEVESTVAGILAIRETVAETTRKVKRLAESSQEISKIVALISQIASRTNLLALNASIEAARAGEAGRGFAIVADEVRQLADRSAKSLKEIEQIVRQIQSETGAVMQAMEEGTQQVIDGTKRAEQAKRALEDIIQVSNRIDVLVRSITADTVEQTQTSQSVAQVMQTVELTAQETSQEAQRVSKSLQSLVGVARDLLNSVERFRVEEDAEEKPAKQE
jgi:twitching motility protein PilJ